MPADNTTRTVVVDFNDEIEIDIQNIYILPLIL